MSARDLHTQTLPETTRSNVQDTDAASQGPRSPLTPETRSHLSETKVSIGARLVLGRGSGIKRMVLFIGLS